MTDQSQSEGQVSDRSQRDEGESQEDYEARLGQVRYSQAFPGGDPYASLDLAKQTYEREQQQQQDREAKESESKSSGSKAEDRSASTDAQSDSGSRDSGSGSDQSKGVKNTTVASGKSQA